MKSNAILCILFFILQLDALAQQTPAEKSVMALSKKKNLWLIQNSYDSIKNLLDSRCLYIHSNGWIQNNTEVLADMKSGSLIYEQIELSKIEARQYEKMVIVNGQGKFSGKMKGNAFTVALVFTEVYVNRKSGWKLVSRHASKLPE